MKLNDLYSINKFYFSPKDVADAFNISYASAKVSCSRYAAKGLIIRLKRNFYVLRNKWQNMSYENIFTAANILQVPSYVSLTTALSYYEITTQIQRDFIESISVKKTKKYDVKNYSFNFSKIKKKYFNNFIKQDTFFIALPEKAFLDALYLTAFNMYRLDFSAIDYKKMNYTKIKKMLKQYPEKVKKSMEKICRI